MYFIVSTPYHLSLNFMYTGTGIRLLADWAFIVPPKKLFVLLLFPNLEDIPS